jgi:glutamate synthase (NADPH/NADH) small chain
MPLNLNRVHMPEQSPEDRRHNFHEVNLGLTPELARQEAGRCLLCKKPTCIAGCPVHVNIPGFIQALTENNPDEAVHRIKQTNTLPAICGRVCPQETQCEAACVLAKKGAPVAIGALERFVGDHALRECLASACVIQNRPERVAVIGSGPSGVTCAGELRKFGYAVTVFEALHELGGVLTYGIPEFRLPKEAIVKPEIETLRSLGVEFTTNALIGRLHTVPELLEKGFAAVYVATGAGYPQFMSVPGEDLNYIYSANEFLTRINLMQAYKGNDSSTPIHLGSRVGVIGGGNTALDSARSALRLPGVEHVTLIYRRSEEEMPGRVEEIKHAKEEGVDIQLLTAPVEYLGTTAGALRAARCQRMQLGEPDATGRRRPVPLAGSDFELALDSVVVAIGTQSNPIIAQTTPGLSTNKYGYIVVNDLGETSLKKIFAGGDIVSGSATVILAMGAGRNAAQTIHQSLAHS